MKTRTLFLIGIGGLAAAALVTIAFRTDPVPVDLHSVASGPMQVTIDADGKTRIKEVYEVASPISGSAQRAPVRVGDPVVAHETVVAVVEPAASSLLDERSRIQAEAAVSEAEAGLYASRSRMRQANEELTHARNEYARAVKLVERGVASVTRMENAQEQLAIRQAAQQAAISSLEMSKSALDRARAALIEPGRDGEAMTEGCCVQITAPVDGRVLSIDVISERPVIAGAGLLTIGHPDDLEIVADLLSTDAVRLAPGNRAMVDRWGGGRSLKAQVSKIEPAAYTKVSALGIEEQRVDVVFDLLTPTEERPSLGDGFSVYLRIVEWEAENVLTVPLSAMFRQGNDWAVFRAEGGVAYAQPIEIGRRNAVSAQIIDGLSKGDRVIMHPHDAIRDGVTITERANALEQD